MIDLLLTGAYRGAPHDIGAWAYAFRRGDELLGEGKGSDRPAAVTSWLSAEAAALALGLEELAREWAGTDVIARTTSAGLQGLLVRQGRQVPQDLSRWYSRARQAAGRLASLRILPVSRNDVSSLRATAEGLLPLEVKGIRLARASELNALKEGRG